MGFYKTGDIQPIEKTFESDGNIAKCSKCGKYMVIIAVTDDENKLVCEACDGVE